MTKKVMIWIVISTILNLIIGCKSFEFETVTIDQIRDSSELIKKVKLKNGEEIVFNEDGGKLGVFPTKIEGRSDGELIIFPISSVENLEWTSSSSQDKLFVGSKNDFLSYIVENYESFTDNITVKKLSSNNHEYEFYSAGGKCVGEGLYISGNSKNSNHAVIHSSNIDSLEVNKFYKSKRNAKTLLSIGLGLGLIYLLSQIEFSTIGSE